MVDKAVECFATIKIAFINGLIIWKIIFMKIRRKAEYTSVYIWGIHIQRKQKEITGNSSGTGMMEL